tara:strand:- start:276 stop:1535 length:1260 start_codon:yes stop_codon:yes gene_type:complete
MNYLLSILLLFFSFASNAQTWKSVPRIDISLSPAGRFTRPWNQFEFNPYTNKLWFVSDTRVSIMETDGNFKIIQDNEELGNMMTGIKLKFAFTPNNIYYASWYESLWTFNNYVTAPVLSGLAGFEDITSNEDTIYITTPGVGGLGLRKYTDAGGVIQSNNYPYRVSSKGIYLYIHKIESSNQVGYLTGPNISDYAILNNDPLYLLANINEVKFSNQTDTLYIAGENGISLAYNYFTVANITPSNTTNMPSSNVLEIDFGANDTLWAVFGDTNGDPFSIAKLSGNTWIDVLDNASSPIDFTNFWGMAIDTLGNPYFIDNQYLHTIISPSSPGWLGLESLSVSNFQTLISPNPSNDKIKITYSQKSIKDIYITDAQGKIVQTLASNSKEVNIDISTWQKGVYFVKSVEKNGKSSFNRFVKE